MFRRTTLSAALFLLGTASAHHSAVMFDITRCVTLTGTVRTFQWQYPHSWLWLIVPDAKGGSAIWGLEFPSPAGLTRSDPQHWNADAFPKGMKVTAYIAPARNGQTGGLMNSAVLPNGYRMHAAPNSAACEAQTYGANQETERLLKLARPH